MSNESLLNSTHVGVIVNVIPTNSQKYGEAQVRVSEVHGDTSNTPDANLPVALYFPQTFPSSFGTFAVGDKVQVRFQNGDPLHPIIEGRLLNLSAVAALVPEYTGNYSKVHGLFDEATGAAIFFNSATGTINLRVGTGEESTNIIINKTSVTINTKDVTTNATGNVTNNVTGNVTNVVEGNMTNTVTGNVTDTITGSLTATLTGAANVTSAVGISLAAPTVSINGAPV